MMNSSLPTASKSPRPASAPPPTASPGARIARGTRPPAMDAPFSPSDGMYQQPILAKWGRRLVSVPALLLLTALYGLALLVLVPYSLVQGIRARQPGFLLLRFHIYIFSVLLIQCAALLYLSFSWFRTLHMSPERRRAANVGVEIWFIPKVIALAELIYGMTIELDGIECCAPGPILLLSRHASILDTILPIKILGQAHGMGMRIVQKAELLWNPVVDVASHRMPRAFIKRGTGDVDSQVEHMQHLLRGIGQNEALVIFPEGSRFTPEKKERIIAKIAKSNPIAAERASRLQCVLPVRPAGTTALMDARPDLDVVFLAHTGLERANRLEDFADGALYRKTLRMKFWRVAASEIPSGEQERLDWLHQEWSKVDAWIVENQD